MSKISRAEKFGSLKEVHFIVRGYLVGFPEIRLTALEKDENDDGNFLALDIISPSLHGIPMPEIADERDVLAMDINRPRQNIDQLMRLRAEISKLKIDKWKRNYSCRDENIIIMDGIDWKLTLKFEEGRTIVREGDNAYPDNWYEFLEILSHYTTVFNFLLEEDEEEDEE